MFKRQNQVFHKVLPIQILLFQIDLSCSLVSLDMEILSPVLNIYSLMQNLLILDVFSLKYNSQVCFVFFACVCVSDLVLYSYTMVYRFNLLYLSLRPLRLSSHARNVHIFLLLSVRY